MKPLLNIYRRYAIQAASMLLVITVLAITSARMKADTAACGGGSVTLPFTDVPAANVFFCSIASAFFSGLTNGTSATTYGPSANVPREQMAAFVSRTLEQSTRRNNLRAVAKKWYLPPDPSGITLTVIGTNPRGVEFDGTDIWVANRASDTVQRLRTSDGLLLQTWTGAVAVTELVAARGRIFGVSGTNPGRLYFIDPTQSAGPVSTDVSNLPANPNGIAFDGARVWTTNGVGNVSIITFNPTQVTNVTAGIILPVGILFDGDNIWIIDTAPNALVKLDAIGNIVQSIPVGSDPEKLVFDGINIWVANNADNSVTVVRVKDSQGNPLQTASVLATLTGNGLSGPHAIAFDGERMLVTNATGNSVSLFKAADLSPLGSISTGAGTSPSNACSDGMSFWVTLFGTGRLARL